MSDLTATVVIPTTGDRGSLLPYSVGSVLAQTVTDLEVFIIGDGLDDDGRAIAEELADNDDRVRYFDFPKDTRRGEHHRHRLLTSEARGRIVTYLCDRDLYLPSHIAELDRLLRDADLAHTQRFAINDDETISAHWRSDLRGPDRQRHHEFARLLPLSFVGHTMDAYRRLPHGWRTTPAELATDRFMWTQFLDQPWCTVAASARPTVLYFKRGDHPGLSTDQRRELLVEWSERMSRPDLEMELATEIIEVLDAERIDVGRRLRNRSAVGLAERVVPAPALDRIRGVVASLVPARFRRRIPPP
jgi:hypothetical protein